MGQTPSARLTEQELRYKPMTPNMTVEGLPAAVFVVKSGNAGLIQQALDSNVPFNIPDQSGKYPLHYAVHDETICKMVLSAPRVSAGCADRSKMTPLHYAVTMGIDCVKLLKDGIFYQDANGDTPLHLAVKMGNHDLVSAILNEINGVPVIYHLYLIIAPMAAMMTSKCLMISYITNSCGHSALVEAVRKHDMKMLGILMKYGDASYDTGGGSAIDHAVKLGRTDNDLGVALLKYLYKK